MPTYCDLCKVNHCGQKAVMLFPEDEVKWVLLEDGVITKWLCQMHKDMLERMNEKWKILGVEFERVG